jgi:hypothetical protein
MAGYKEWAIGEVVEAGDFQGFIQNQTVMVFDSESARTTALTGVVAEGMTSYLKDINAVQVYNGTSWVAIASDPPSAFLLMGA